MTIKQKKGSYPTYEIGDVLSIPQSIYRHYMIVVGPGFVAHASKESGVVAIDRIDDVASNKLVKNHGRWSKLPDVEIIRRVHAAIGKQYKLFSRNCEHFVRDVSGFKQESPQIGLALVCVFVLIGAVVVRKRFA